MRTKKIEERFKGMVAGINRLEQRILALETNGQITRSRPLTEKELNGQNPNLTCGPTMHIDTYPLKEIILLLLDLLGLEPEKTLEKIELIKLKAKEGKQDV